MQITYKNLLKAAPYITSIIVGFVFFFLSKSEGFTGFKDLFVNIAATLFAIPIVLAAYETIRNLAHKELNSEIYDYCKVRVDTELLRIVGHARKSTCSITEIRASSNALKEVSDFLALSYDHLFARLSDGEFLGFQIFKQWSEGGEAIDRILNNPFHVRGLSDDQIITLIKIKKCLSHVYRTLQEKGLYTATGTTCDKFRILNALDVSPENVGNERNYLLLEKISNDTGRVVDFGILSQHHAKNLSLHHFKINRDLVPFLCTSLIDLNEAINEWVKVTGGELLIDPLEFRIRPYQ